MAVHRRGVKGLSGPHGLRSFPAGRRGLTLVEVLVAFVIILVALYGIYSVFLGGSNAASSARVRLTALDFAQMELEDITGMPYDELPPEEHLLNASASSDQPRVCRLTLKHRPLKGSLRICRTDGSAVEDALCVDYSAATIDLPAEMDRQAVIVSYDFEYPRREQLVVPRSAPYRVRLSSYPVGRMARVTDGEGKALPAQLDAEDGFLEFQAQEAGKTISVEYRGENDAGVVQCSYIAGDLSSHVDRDAGLKLVKITETWQEQGKKRTVELSYVRAR